MSVNGSGTLQSAQGLGQKSLALLGCGRFGAGVASMALLVTVAERCRALQDVAGGCRTLQSVAAQDGGRLALRPGRAAALVELPSWSS